MKDKILSFAGMGIKRRSSSDPLITHLSPTNHPLLQKAWKYTTCMILALLLGVGQMWAIDYYTPTADEVIYLVSSSSISTHSAIGNASNTYTLKTSQTIGNPEGTGTTTKDCLQLKKGNSKKTLVVNISGCSSVILYHNSHSSRYAYATLTPSEGSATTQKGTNSTTSTTITLDGTKSYSILFVGCDGNDETGGDLNAGAIKLIKYVDPGCTTPTVTFSAASATADKNEEVTLTFTSQNTNAVSYTIKKGGEVTADASITDGKFTATEYGKYVITATQTADATYCAVEKSVTITVYPPLTGWVVFDGVIDEAFRTSPVVVSTVSLAFESSSASVQDVSSKTNATGRPYAKGMQISKSTSGYFKFTIPSGYTGTFTYAFSGTGNRTIMLASEKISSTSAEGYIATLTSSVTSGNIIRGEYSTDLVAGDYYICEGGSGNWQIDELAFTLVEATTYTVTYALNGGTGTTPTETDKAEGAKFTLHDGTTGITAPTDKEFSKWKDQDDNEYAAGAEFTMPGKDVTLTAQWVDAITRYTVTYDLNGGEGDAPTETDKAENEVFALAAIPTRAGYNFTGWLCDADADVKAAGASYTMTAANTTFTAQWEAYVACADVVPATSGESPASAGDAISVTGTGAAFTMLNNQTSGKTGDITYSASGLLFANSSSVGIVVTLDHLMKEGTVITATISADYKDNANRGLLLHNASGTKKADWVWKPATDALQEEKVFTYTVEAGDGLAGNNVFRIVRSTNAWLKSLTVSNCGAELIYYDLTSAVSPTGKGTVALSASSLLEGETATATYSDIDENYEFDEWVVSGTGASIDDASANPVTITMGSADAVITLKLKEKAGYAVTYKANNDTEEADVVVAKESTFAANTFTAPDGKKFDGWNTQADGEGTAYAVGDAVPSAITVYAKWVVDNTIKLIKNDGTLNTDDFVTGATLKEDGPFTVGGVEYAKNAQFGNSCSGVSSIDNLNKAIIYHTTTDATKVTIVAYDNYTGGSTANLIYAVVPEGTTTATATTKTMNKSTGDEYEVNMTGRSTLYIYAGHKEVRICQVLVEETGTANAVAPAVGYSVNLNKQRPFLTSGAVTEFEGIEYKVSSNYKPLNGQVQIQTLETNYISFEIPEGETRQLQLTTSNTNKYTVSKTLGDNTESKKVSGNQNINLTAGTWYINPQGSNVNITTIAFAAAPDALTVTFKDDATTLGTQNVWSGEKATEPTAPTKDGYRFVEWQLSGSAYDFDTEVTADIILDAAWQEVVTVTFVPANGEDSFTKQADKGAVLAVEDRPVPEWAGHVFQGWTRNASAEPVVYVNLATETFSEDATLTAVWEVAQNDATISALSYNGNAIDVESAEDVSGVATYTVHLQWGSTIDKDLISVTKSASTATVGTIAYDSDAKKATFTVTAGDDITTANYAIQFVIDAKRGTSLIKATTNNVVTGLIGGTIDQSYSGNANTRKLNANNYFGVTLANDETFQEGDVFIINITTAADLGKFMVYADAARTVLVEDQGIVYTKPDVADPVVCPTGEMRLVLPAAVAGKKSLYLSRENSATAQWNPTFSYIEVTREMDPAIKSFKIGEAEGTINESAKTISIDVPYATDVTGLTPEVEAYGNNGATYTPDGETNFTNLVDYVVTDAYGELSTTYAVTVNVAAPSENAYLASLSVAGYTLDFNKETTTYNVVLDYGTTDLPEITFAVEEDGLANAVKVEGGVNGATTITVTPQAGESYKKVYTINFSVSTTPKFVIYDGSTMTTIAESGSDVSTGFAWTMVGGNTNGAKDVNATLNGKTYTKGQNVFGSATNSNTRYIEITIPNDYVAKFYLAGATNSKNELRSSYISKEKTGTLDKSIAYVSADQYTGAAMRSDYQLPGTYYYCSDASIRLYELSVQLYPIDYTRDVTEGRYGTICLPNGGVMVGASIYEVAYFGETSKKIFFDEVLNGVMVAGVPYVFLPKEGVSKLAVTYTDAANEEAKAVNGLVGSYTEKVLDNDGSCYVLYNNQYLQVVDNGAIVKVGANRAYIILDNIGRTEPALAPGRRRISMGVQSEQVATGIGDVQGDEVQSSKVLINGQLFILRGEKMYDATGRLVK